MSVPLSLRLSVRPSEFLSRMREIKLTRHFSDPTEPQQTPSWPHEQQQQQPATDLHLTSFSERLVQPAKADQQQPPLPMVQQPVQPVVHTVHDLEPMARYSMRVVAVNGVGRSRPSIALALRTEEEGEFLGRLTSPAIEFGAAERGENCSPRARGEQLDWPAIWRATMRPAGRH